MEIKDAQKSVAKFAEERGWHINMLSQRGEHLQREVGKLSEHILFKEGVTIKTPSGSFEKQIGDVLFSLLSLANRAGVDVEKQLKIAMEQDEAKYPAIKTKDAQIKAFKEHMHGYIEEIKKL